MGFANFFPSEISEEAKKNMSTKTDKSSDKEQKDFHWSGQFSHRSLSVDSNALVLSELLQLGSRANLINTDNKTKKPVTKKSALMHA